MNNGYNQGYGYGYPQGNPQQQPIPPPQWHDQQYYQNYQQQVPAPINNNQNYNCNYDQNYNAYNSYNQNQQQYSQLAQQQNQSQQQPQAYNGYNQIPSASIPDASIPPKGSFINRGSSYGAPETSPYQYSPQPMQQQAFPRFQQSYPQPIPPPNYQPTPFLSSPQVPQSSQHSTYTQPNQPVQTNSQYYPQTIPEPLSEPASVPTVPQAQYQSPIPQSMAQFHEQTFQPVQQEQSGYHQASQEQQQFDQASSFPPPPPSEPVVTQYQPDVPQQLPAESAQVPKPPAPQQLPAESAQVPQPPAPQQYSQQPQPTPQSVKKRRVEELQTPSKPVFNSSRQGTPDQSLNSEPNFNFEHSQTNIQPDEIFQITEEQFEEPKMEVKNNHQLKTLLDKPGSDVALFFNVANELNTHADRHSKNIKTKKNLQEYYTLKQLAILNYKKILTHKPKVSKEYRLKCHSKLGDIYQGLSDINNEEQSDPLDTAGYHFDQVLLLCGEHNLHQKLITQIKIVNLLMEKHQYKQALRLLDDIFEYLSFNDSIYLIHLKFQILTSIDPSQALPYLQSMLRRLTLVQVPDVYNDGLLLLKLNEFCYAIQQGIQPVTDISLLQSNDIINSIHIDFVRILSSVTNKQLNDVKETERLFKKASTALSELKSKQSKTQYHLPFAGKIITISDQMPTYKLNILICLMYGISLLNSTHQKRKSLNLFEKSLKLIDEQLAHTSGSLLLTKSHQRSVDELYHLKALVMFFKVIENSIIGPINQPLLEDFETYIEKLSMEIQTSFIMKMLYTISLKLQLEGDLVTSRKSYKSLINQLDFILRTKKEYSEIYIFTILNYLLLVESAIHFYTRASRNDLIPDLAQERKFVLSRLDEILTAKDSTIQSKHLVSMTLAFIKMVYNYENLSKIEINEQVSTILKDFEKIRDYPLLCSILLYIKSDTLNSNSDQKQKSSQTSFNLAKLGYSPMMRYLSGVLNQNNATIARNFQQAEIQSQKLMKIRRNIENTIQINHFNVGRSNDA